MSKLVPLAMLAAACSFDVSNQVGGDGSPIPDAPADANGGGTDGALVDASPTDATAEDAAMVCVGDLMGFDLLNMDRCDPNDPIAGLILDQPGDYVFDGNTLALTDPAAAPVALDIVVVPQVGGEDLLVITMTDLQIGVDSHLHLLGARPVVLISTGNITIGGRIQATARNGLAGAGANLNADCVTGAGSDGEVQTDNNGRNAGSGGGGGGFGTAGGTGARHVNSNGIDSPGGPASASLTLEPLRGGCAGGSGGGQGGEGGHGGGAVHLAAAGTISLLGVISASGDGGGGVNGSASGGGGGGTGGAVLIQADSLVNLGIITVNGGAGGEGSRLFSNTDAGEDGRLTTDDPAIGGSGTSNGGNGGNGSTIATVAGNGTEGNQSDLFSTGSGGGGGGIGVVRIDLVNP